jgi:hypothetical protein
MERSNVLMGMSLVLAAAFLLAASGSAHTGLASSEPLLLEDVSGSWESDMQEWHEEMTGEVYYSMPCHAWFG